MMDPTFDQTSRDDEEVRYLHVVSGDLEGDNFAVIRCKWYSDNRLIGISEHRLEHVSKQVNLEDFGIFVANCLKGSSWPTA
jgi:hypothetical protein